MGRFENRASEWLTNHPDTDVFPPLGLDTQGCPDAFCEWAFKRNGDLRPVVQLSQN